MKTLVSQHRSARLPRLLCLALLASWLLLPFRTGAQVAGGAPSGTLIKTAEHGSSLCVGDTIVYTLALLETSPATVEAYRAVISDTLPMNTTFAGHGDDPTLSYDSSSNTITWTPSIEPAAPADEPPTAVFSATVAGAAGPLPDGTQIVNTASGLLGGVTPVEAAVTSVVACEAEAPRDPADYPEGNLEPPAEEAQEEPAQLATPELDGTEPATDSLLLEPELGDATPPGYYQVQLPLVGSSGTTSASAPVTVRQRTPGSGAGLDLSPPRPTTDLSLARGEALRPTGLLPGDIGPILGLPKCDTVFPWSSRHGMSELTYLADSTKWDTAGYRPIAVSANGAGADARFSSVWLKDNRYGEDWRLRHDMTGAAYQTNLNNYGAAGYVPITIDLYGTTASPRYAAIWVKEAKTTASEHGLDQEAMQDEIDARAAQGFRPLWVSGLGSTTDNNPIFAGLWVQDVFTGTMRIGLTDKDISSDGLARSMANKGYRMAHLSGYQTLDGTRYAAVWVKDPACTQARWEAFRDQTSTRVQVKTAAQRSVTGPRAIQADGSLPLKASDFNSSRMARVAVKLMDEATPYDYLSGIVFTDGSAPLHGDILVLQPTPKATGEVYRIIVVDHFGIDNIRLRSWKPDDPTVSGQQFALDNYQYRIVLQYNSALQKWVELERNNISPDYYWPSSVDEYGSTSARRYSSVWRAGPTDRVWRVAQPGAANGTLPSFDVAMQTYMQRLNVPNGVLAIAVDGELKLLRSYSWQPSYVAVPIPQYARFRLASVSKPLTAIGIMQLVEDGQLALDQKIKDIPGFDAILKSGSWSDADIKLVTVRHLLSHTAGWDRDLAPDPMLNDWNVCNGQNLTLLPTTLPDIVAYMRTQNIEHTPGSAYAYSNFGYALLGMIIEHVSGTDYESFIKANVLQPVNAHYTTLGKNVEKAIGEVTYYRPNNAMGTSVLGFPAHHLPERDPCNKAHADVAHVSYGGGHNVEAMDAHGGWISTAGDLARVLVGLEQNTLLGEAARNEMWSRQAGRERRVMLYDGATKSLKDYTLHARSNESDDQPDKELRIDGFDSTQDALFVGQGLVKFSELNLAFTSAGQGYTIKILYPKKGGGFGELTGVNTTINDGTENFSKSGKATFTAPKDWNAVVIGALDPRPKYYLLLQTTTTPLLKAKIDQLTTNGEDGYGLGWSVAEKTYTLEFSGGNGKLSKSLYIVGEQSKASAKILELPTGTLRGTMVLEKLAGGSFLPGEALLVNGAPAATATDREWYRTGDASHGGLLWGTKASMKHRADGVSWVALFNQDSTYDPYWYLPSDGSIFGKIDDLIGPQHTQGWPDFNLFNP